MIQSLDSLRMERFVKPLNRTETKRRYLKVLAKADNSLDTVVWLSVNPRKWSV